MSEASSWLHGAVRAFGEVCRVKLASPGDREAAIRAPLEPLLRTVGNACACKLSSTTRYAPGTPRLRGADRWHDQRLRRGEGLQVTRSTLRSSTATTGWAATGPNGSGSAHSRPMSARQSPSAATASARSSRTLPGSCTPRGLRHGSKAADNATSKLSKSHPTGLRDNTVPATRPPAQAGRTDTLTHLGRAYDRSGNKDSS